METVNVTKNTEFLRELIGKLKLLQRTKADILICLCWGLHESDPEGFKELDNLTWPEGRAILLSSNRENIERTNPTAQIKSIPRTEFFIDTGLDNEAMRKLVEIMMRDMAVESGLINQYKNLFQVKQHGGFTLWP